MLRQVAHAGNTSLSEAAWNIPRTLQVASVPGWPPEPFHAATRPTLIWDVDNVLAFTGEAICGALNARFGSDYDVMTQTFYQGTLLPGQLPGGQASWLMAELATFRIFATCAPDWRAIDTMTAAQAAGYHCWIVTERAPDLAAKTADWLKSWGVRNPPAVTAVGVGNKPRVISSRYGAYRLPGSAAVLIDDNPLTRMTVAREGLDVWLPARPYNGGPERPHTRSFTDWQQARYWLGLSPSPE